MVSASLSSFPALHAAASVSGSHISFLTPLFFAGPPLSRHIFTRWNCRLRRPHQYRIVDVYQWSVGLSSSWHRSSGLGRPRGGAAAIVVVMSTTAPRPCRSSTFARATTNTTCASRIRPRHRRRQQRRRLRLLIIAMSMEEAMDV
jgi:hypothetical protein